MFPDFMLGTFKRKNYEKRVTMASIVDNRSELELFLSGESTHAYEYLGSHFMEFAGRKGVVFRVWAPNAKSVAVVGDFNGWNIHANYMYRVLGTSVW